MMMSENEIWEQIHQYWKEPQPDEIKIENEEGSETENQCHW